jgi:O-methyltransferase involved in polyketide biosynthesis
VVLEADLDTFAYRNPHPGPRVVDVDHPTTQVWKRRCLAEADILIPEGVSFAALNFATGLLSAALGKAGLRHDEPSFFSRLG